MPDNPITLAGDFSKPVVVLIEKINDAVAGALRPYQIVRVAKAEAKAAVIRGKTEIQVANLERRALRRFVAEETRKQANMEQIIRGAVPLVEETATPQNVPDDWIANFFEKCRIISDGEMQGLWSRILAGEANSPSSFSKRTVNLLSDLDKVDATCFTNLCAFAWAFGEGDLVEPLIFDMRNTELYGTHGMDFSALTHLESLGLVRFDNLTGFAYYYQSSSLKASYLGRTVQLTLPAPPNSMLNVGKVIFTRSGLELSRVCATAPVDGFFEYVCSMWQRLSYLPQP